MTEEIALVSNNTFIPTRTGLIVNGDATDEEWVEFGGRIKNAQEGILWILGDWARYGEVKHSKIYVKTLEKYGYTTQTVMDAKWLSGLYESSRRRDDISWSFYREAASLAKEGNAADELLERAATDVWTVKKLRAEVRDLKLLEPAPLKEADGTYDVIYADPPWKYEAGTIKDDLTIERQYPTMELEDIKNLEIPAAKDSICFLWTTAPKLEEGLEVLKAWGFQYRTCAVWDKETLGLGWYFRVQHEILLVGKKGKYPIPAESRRPRSVIRERRTTHSKKPEKVARIIEDMYPDARKIELFARRKRFGWDTWGNEIDESQQNLDTPSQLELGGNEVGI